MIKHLVLSTLLGFFLLCAPASAQAKPLKFAGPAEKCWFESSGQKTPTQSVVRKCGLGNAAVRSFCHWHCSSVRGGSAATCAALCKTPGSAAPVRPAGPGRPTTRPGNDDADNAPKGRGRRGSASEAYCRQNPNLSECRGSEAYCKQNPNLSECRGSEAYCRQNPNLSECRGSNAYCKQNPYLSECRGSEAYCKNNPYLSECRGSEAYCQNNPNLSECRGSEAYCKQNPNLSECR